MTTINISQKTKELLKEVKESNQLKSYDATVRHILSESNQPTSLSTMAMQMMNDVMNQIVEKAENDETLLKILDSLKRISRVASSQRGVIDKFKSTVGSKLKSLNDEVQRLANSFIEEFGSEKRQLSEEETERLKEEAEEIEGED